MIMSAPKSLYRLLSALAAALAVVCAATAPAREPTQADSNQTGDVVFLRNGGVQKGELLEVTGGKLRFRVILRADQPPATIAIPIEAIERIELLPDRELERILGAPESVNREELVSRWDAIQELLGVASSPAGALGLAAADALLAAEDIASRQRAVEIFERIENEDWNEQRRGRARSGRLRAKIALGQGEEAVEEARRLALEADSPEVAIEANLLLGNAAFAQLRKLEEEHPRWSEDVFVRPERARLFHDALDRLLYPALCHGWREPDAARGLWAAAGVYRFDGRIQEALELARDIVELYPGSAQAEPARVFISENAEDISFNADSQELIPNRSHDDPD